MVAMTLPLSPVARAIGRADPLTPPRRLKEQVSNESVSNISIKVTPNTAEKRKRIGFCFHDEVTPSKAIKNKLITDVPTKFEENAPSLAEHESEDDIDLEAVLADIKNTLKLPVGLAHADTVAEIEETSTPFPSPTPVSEAEYSPAESSDEIDSNRKLTHKEEELCWSMTLEARRIIRAQYLEVGHVVRIPGDCVRAQILASRILFKSVQDGALRGTSGKEIDDGFDHAEFADFCAGAAMHVINGNIQMLSVTRSPKRLPTDDLPEVVHILFNELIPSSEALLELVDQTIDGQCHLVFVAEQVLKTAIVNVTDGVMNSDVSLHCDSRTVACAAVCFGAITVLTRMQLKVDNEEVFRILSAHCLGLAQLRQAFKDIVSVYRRQSDPKVKVALGGQPGSKPATATKAVTGPRLRIVRRLHDEFEV